MLLTEIHELFVLGNLMNRILLSVGNYTYDFCNGRDLSPFFSNLFNGQRFIIVLAKASSKRGKVGGIDMKIAKNLLEINNGFSVKCWQKACAMHKLSLKIDFFSPRIPLFYLFNGQRFIIVLAKAFKQERWEE